MTQEEINQNNDDIMRFMGCRLAPCSNGKAWESPNEHYGTEMGRMHGRLQQSAWNGMGFHRSWDWLMPVVEKIDQILPDDSFVLIEYNRCIIPVLEAEEPFDIDFVCNTRLEATYRAAVEFIRWHSEEKAKEGAR
jgi:hypothetical protein